MPDSVNTGGGSHIGGDANPQHDFVGRDQINFIFEQAARYKNDGAWHMLGGINPNFAGRADEISRILTLARQPNLRDGAVSITSLTGMGGIGKTELATVVAHALRADFPDGELVFELKSHSLAKRAPAQELTRVLQLLYPQDKLPEDVASLRGVYANALRGKRCVVMIDDADTDAQVDALRPPSGCVALITSRHQLARGQRVPIKKLNRAESVEVLSKYRTLSAADADALAARCADHPLALNVAGAFLSHNEAVSAPIYMDALNQNRVKAFSAGVDENDETQSLFAVFGYSFWSLSDEQQAAWLALSEMPASFERAAGVAVSGVAEDALKHPLNRLAEYNLLEFDPTTQRFAWHDLLKEYASARLRPPERTAAQRRHAEHFIQVAYEADELYLQGGDGVVQGLALFDRERAQIETAFANLHKLEAHQEVIELVNAVKYTSDLRFHPRRRIEWLEAQRHAAQASGNKQAEGAALGNLGNAYKNLGEASRAIEFYEQSLVIKREIGDRHGEGNALGNLGLAYAALGDARRAIEFYEQDLAIARKIGDRRGEGNALGNLGNAYAELGDARRAIEFYEQDLVIAREIGDRRGEGAALGNLGNAYAELGEARRAIEYHEQALKVMQEIGDKRTEGSILGNLGLAYAALGDVSRAIAFYEQQLKIVREIGDRRGEGNALGNLGNAYADLGDARRAIEFYEQRLVIAREIGDKQGEANASWNLGLIYEAQGDLDRAVALMQVRVDFLRQIGHPDADKDAAVVAGIRAKM